MQVDGALPVLVPAFLEPGMDAKRKALLASRGDILTGEDAEAITEARTWLAEHTIPVSTPDVKWVYTVDAVRNPPPRSMVWRTTKTAYATEMVTQGVYRVVTPIDAVGEMDYAWADGRYIYMPVGARTCAFVAGENDHDEVAMRIVTSLSGAK